MSRRSKTPKLPLPGQSGLPQQVTVDLSTAENIFCSRCGNFAFLPSVTFKKLSAIMSPTGKEGVVPVETFMCSECGYIPPEFMPVPIVPPSDEEEEDIRTNDLPKTSVSDGGIILSTSL